MRKLIFVLLLILCSSCASSKKNVDCDSAPALKDDSQFEYNVPDIQGWRDTGISLRIFCPECKKADLKSTVWRGMTYTTLMNINEYWDEDGNRHYDDPNISTTEWWCSNDHSWKTVEGEE